MTKGLASVLIGFCPIGKFVFSHEDAMNFKGLLEEKLTRMEVRFVSLEGVLDDGIVRSQNDVPKVVEHFKKRGVQALFMPHCNFGTEGAVAMIGAQTGVPVLLWGPRDGSPLPDGTRLRDSLCGLFASSKVLHKLNVPFTYIDNCRIDDPQLGAGIEKFIRAVNVADAFRNGMRIGHLGQRIDFFWTTIINESELLSRFKVEVQPLDMVEFIQAAKARAQSARKSYLDESAELRRDIEIQGLDNDDALVNILAVRDQMLEVAKGNNLDGLAVQDFMSLVNETGAYCFYSDSAVADRYAVGYESDIHGTISSVLAMRANLGDPAFLADVTVRHPQNDNGVLIWHAGAPLSMRHPDSQIRLGHHWILPSPLSGMPHFRLKEGPMTLTRFDGDHGDYCLAIGEGRSIDGPYTQNNYVWMEVNDWPAWERALIEGPFIHHIAMTYGNFADVLEEACRYIPGLKPLRLDRRESL